MRTTTTRQARLVRGALRALEALPARASPHERVRMLALAVTYLCEREGADPDLALVEVARLRVAAQERNGAQTTVH